MRHDDEYTRNEQDFDKLEPEMISERSPFIKWLDNYWYHYKWPTIIISFFAILAIMLTFQMINRPEYDETFLYACTYRMNVEEYQDYEQLLEKILPDDYDGNGEKSINIMSYQIYSEEEFYEASSIAEANSDSFSLNGKYNTDEFHNFSQYSMTGECSVYLISEYLFNQLRSAERLRPIAELYEGQALPAGVTEDGFGIRISTTDFYNYNPAAQILPDDMILCLLRPTVWGGSSNDVRYERSVAFFHAIADYRIKN